FSEELGLDLEGDSVRRRQNSLLPADQGRSKGELGTGRKRSGGLDWLEGSGSDVEYKPTPADQGRSKGELGTSRKRSSGLDWLEGSGSDVEYKPTLERAGSRDSVPTLERETMSNKASVGTRGELDWCSGSGSDSEYKSNLTSASRKLKGANELTVENRSAGDKPMSERRRGSGLDWLGGSRNESEHITSGLLGGSGRRRGRQQPQTDLLGFEGEINSQVSKTEKTPFAQKDQPVDLIERPSFFPGEPTNKNFGGIKQDESSGIDKNQVKHSEGDDWLLLKKKFEANKSPVSPKLVSKTASPSKSEATGSSRLVQLSPAKSVVGKPLNQELSDHRVEDVAVGASPYVSTGFIATPTVVNTPPNPIVQANHVELEGLLKSLHLERDQLIQSMEAMRTRYQEEMNHLQSFYQNQQKTTDETFQLKEI
ncbi:uncharacterized protein LOC111084276, partial [Limulus polyphemus]|uniref:Uncharacterized protein LOC111084276 n=1 Tax=Limulus polyphemus TaxID=6850 RepID=A0ABM1RZE0_LIMPO